MIGYLFLFAALIAGTVKGYCGKHTSGKIVTYRDAMLVSTIRMVICVLIGIGILLIQKNVSALAISTPILLITLLAGVMNATNVLTWLISVKDGSYLMLDVFSTAGVLIPVLGGFFAFGEAIRINHLIGFVILLVAVFLMSSYNNSIKKKLTFRSVLLLLGCSIGNGFFDFSQKLFAKTAGSVPITVFNFYTYLFSTIFLFICFLIFRKEQTEEGAKEFRFRSVALFVMIMAVCLFIYSFFKTTAAKYIPSAQLYPLAQGCGLILSIAMTSLVFKEKLTLKCIVGVALSFAALIIINVL